MQERREIEREENRFLRNVKGYFWINQVIMITKVNFVGGYYCNIAELDRVPVDVRPTFTCDPIFKGPRSVASWSHHQ